MEEVHGQQICILHLELNNAKIMEKKMRFITIFDKQIQTVLSSTYLGGNGIDVANGIVVSDQGNIGIVGTTNSTTNFLNENETGNTTPQGMEDVFFTIFTNPMSAQEKVETTFLGGTNADYGQAIAHRYNHGNVYLAGNTWSNDYPTTIWCSICNYMQLIFCSIQKMYLYQKWIIYLIPNLQ